MKKQIILALAGLTLGTSTLKASWFHDDSEKERRIQVEQQLTLQRRDTGNWQGVAFVLGIGSVMALIGGTIIGSRARHHATRKLR